MRDAALASYRREHPLPESRAAGGLAIPGTRKEVTREGRGVPLIVEAYTLPESAEALGRSELCFKRWVAEGMVPPPVLRDTVRGYRHYSAGELQSIAAGLAVHEGKYAYFTATHSTTISDIWERVRRYRSTGV